MLVVRDALLHVGTSQFTQSEGREMMTTSIEKLIASLSTAIWQRAKADPEFNLLYYLTHASEYVPVTEQELRIWAEITCPDNYVVLRDYIARQEGFPRVSGYALAMYSLLLTAATARYEGVQ